MTDPDIQRARNLAKNARHDSVTPERLTETKRGMGRYRLHDDPVYRYLEEDEQPEFLFYAEKETPTLNGPGAPDEIERSRRHQVIHLVTDSRWLMIAGNKEGDQTQNFPLDAVKSVNYDVSGNVSDRFSNNCFVIEFPETHCSIPISNDFGEESLEDLSIYLRNEFGANRGGVPIDSDEAGYTIAGSDSINYDEGDVRSRLDRLPETAVEDANDLISKANSVEELVPRLDALLEECQSEEETLDDVVAEATTVAEVRQAVETPQERSTRRAKDMAENQIESAKQILEDANPEDVGTWGLNVGSASAPLAVAAPGSTPLWIAATLILGGAAGAHSSGVEDSPLADVDPEELSEHVLAMADSGRELSDINGELAGTLLGAFTYLGGKMAPEQFTKWIEAADTDAILTGANAGAAYSKRGDVNGDALEGAIAGSGLGLLGSFAGIEDETSFDSEVADEIERYLAELAEKGVQVDPPTETSGRS